jgi:putative transposase
LLDFRSMHDLAEAHRRWVEEAIEKEDHFRDGKWTESIAVGSESFVKAAKVKLGIKAKGREILGQDGSYRLGESPVPYKGNFEPENEALRLQNEYLWEDIA